VSGFCYNGFLDLLDDKGDREELTRLMRIGFSTGGVARGDYRQALDVLQRNQVNVVELSALRMSELEPLVSDLGQLELSRFSFISFHFPSTFEKCDEPLAVEAYCRRATKEVSSLR